MERTRYSKEEESDAEHDALESTGAQSFDVAEGDMSTDIDPGVDGAANQGDVKVITVQAQKKEGSASQPTATTNAASKAQVASHTLPTSGPKAQSTSSSTSSSNYTPPGSQDSHHSNSVAGNPQPTSSQQPPTPQSPVASTQQTTQPGVTQRQQTPSSQDASLPSVPGNQRGGTTEAPKQLPAVRTSMPRADSEPGSVAGGHDLASPVQSETPARPTYLMDRQGLGPGPSYTTNTASSPTIAPAGTSTATPSHDQEYRQYQVLPSVPEVLPQPDVNTSADILLSGRLDRAAGGGVGMMMGRPIPRLAGSVALPIYDNAPGAADPFVDQSVQLARASTMLVTQATQVEALERRLSEALAARDRAVAALQEQARLHQDSESSLRSMFEAEVADVRAEAAQQLLRKAQELQVAAAKIDRLEQQIRSSTAVAGHDKGRPGTASSLVSTPTAAAGNQADAGADVIVALRKEVSEQERLLLGYQQENEAAIKRIKELEAILKEATTARAPAASSILTGPHSQQQQHDATDNRPATAGGAGGGTTGGIKETAARLQQVLDLQQQLEATREQSAVRESELRQEMDRLRHRNRELEAKAGGVDLHANKEADVLVKSVRQEMDAMRSQYQSAIAELQSKLSWYAENQELLAGTDKLVKQQRAAIAVLEAKVAEYEGPEGMSSARRITELQAQVASLQAALKSKGLSKGLAAVIEATKAAGGGGSGLGARSSGQHGDQGHQVAALQRKVEQLNAKLEEKDAEYELSLRSYQQQYESLRHQVQERQSDVQSAGAAKRREAALQAQLDEQRTHYTRQMRELKEKLKQAQAQARHPHTTTGMGGHGGYSYGPSSPAGAGATGAASGQIPSSVVKVKEAETGRLQQELQRRTKQVAELHLKLGEVEARLVSLGGNLGTHAAAPGALPAPATSLPATPAARGVPLRESWQEGHTGTPTHNVDHHRNHQAPDQQQQRRDAQLALAGLGVEDLQGVDDGRSGAVVALAVQQLQQQNTALTAQLATLQQQLLKVVTQGSGAASPAAADVEVLRRRADAAELALATLQRNHSEAIERAAVQQSEFQRAVLRAQDDVTQREASRWQDKVSSMEMDLQAARLRVQALESELADTKRRLSMSWSPGAAEFAALENKLEAMATEAEEREAKWCQVLEDARQLYAVQAELVQKKCEAGLAVKSAELEGLKARVDELLTNAARYPGQKQIRP